MSGDGIAGATAGVALPLEGGTFKIHIVAGVVREVEVVVVVVVVSAGGALGDLRQGDVGVPATA